MAAVDALYHWLLNGPTPDCDHILGAALDRAEPEDFGRLTRTLIARPNIAAWSALLAHYERLDASLRSTLQSDDHLWRSGVAGAFKHASANSRSGALTALAEKPSIKLAYLIPHALRDQAGRVRDAAVQAFRRIADQVWNSTDIPADEVGVREAAADRAQFIQTLQGLLRTFDRHHRVEVVEVCLWFADELGAGLWETLENSRMRLNRVVEEHLERWNGPRLVRFLLLALTRADWRLIALRHIRALEGPETGLALLRCARLLENDEIARAIANTRISGWFKYFDAGMSRVPPGLRAAAPAFIARMGLDEREKISLLSSWLDSAEAAVRAATIYALARMETQAAISLLDRVVEENRDGATFAKWYLSGRRGAIRKPSAAAKRPAEIQRAKANMDMDDVSPAAVWQRYRAFTGAERYDAIENIRSNIADWSDRISMYSRSPDPADRLLVLQICERADLLARFAADLRPLISDATPVVRNLAMRLLAQPAAAASVNQGAT
ncbi:MAG: hypothetical protein JNG88_15970, partial [Phycisphaerales bacterium]|nr:hypothetical protein [Phycisphaerales bacterium]